MTIVVHKNLAFFSSNLQFLWLISPFFYRILFILNLALVSLMCVLSVQEIIKAKNQEPRSKPIFLKIKHARWASNSEQKENSRCKFWRAQGEAFQTLDRGKTKSWSPGKVWKTWGRRARMSLSGVPMMVCCVWARCMEL